MYSVFLLVFLEKIYRTENKQVPDEHKGKNIRQCKISDNKNSQVSAVEPLKVSNCQSYQKNYIVCYVGKPKNLIDLDNYLKLI
jgi:hypothetical protein